MPEHDEPPEGGGGPPGLGWDLLMILSLFGAAGLLMLFLA